MGLQTGPATISVGGRSLSVKGYPECTASGFKVESALGSDGHRVGKNVPVQGMLSCTVTIETETDMDFLRNFRGVDVVVTFRDGRVFYMKGADSAGDQGVNSEEMEMTVEADEAYCVS